MRLYPKKIHSFQELREERHMLIRAAKASGGDLFSSKDGDSKKRKDNKDDDEGGVDLGGILSSVIGSKGTLNLVLSTGLPLLINMIPRKTKIKYFRKFIGEFAEAYVGWKAVKLSYQVISSLVKKSKAKKEVTTT